MSHSVKVTGLCKRVRGQDLVKDISFTIRQGDIVGFLGPNGAGKSTTIKLMLGLLKPTEGRVELCGYDIGSEREKALLKVGAMVETPAFYGYMTGYENLKLYARLYGLDNDRVPETLRLVHLYDEKDKKVGCYSLGMKQRLGIARAFLNKPSLIILDEPTNGLDPIGIMEIRNIIKDLADRGGVTFMISSHILGEVEAMCNKWMILNRGRLLAFGDRDSLLQETGCRTLEEYYIHILGEHRP